MPEHRNHTSLAHQVYGYLADDEDARVCKDIPDAACHEQPRSFLLQLLANSLTKLGDSIASPRLVLAWLLSTLGAPAVFVAMLVPVRESLALLPQLFIAQFLRERAVRKVFWVAGAIVQAGALGAMLVAALTIEGAALGIAIIGALAVFSLARGVCSVTAKDVLGKTVSRTRRGRLTGQSASIAGAIALVVAAIVVFAPALDASRMLFALLLGIAALLWLVAALLYARIPEMPGATSGGGNAFREAVRSLGLLVHDRQFAAFVWTRVLLVATAFAIPYLVVLVARAGSAGATTLGAMLAADGLAGLVAGAAWGRFADRSARGVMTAAASLSVLVMIAALLLAGFARPLLGHVAVAAALLFAAAVAHHGVRVGRKTYLVDMADSENRASYVAVSNTVMGVVLFAGVLLGWLDHARGASAVLMLLAVIGAFAAFRSARLPDVSG